MSQDEILKFTNKIIRSICYFTKNPIDETVKKLSVLNDLLASKDYEVQTKRICASGASVKEMGKNWRKNQF